MAALDGQSPPDGTEDFSPPCSLPNTQTSSNSATKLPPLEDISLSSPAGQAMPSRAKNKKTAPKRTLKKSKWNAENILNDPASPLALADLRSVLSNPMAWEALNKEEKAEIIDLFPDEEHILRGDKEGDEACFNLGTLLNDDSFRRDCAAYTRNIAEGKHDPDWLASAWSAHERRKIGDFDDFLIDEFEKAWEVELPASFKPQRQPIPTAALESTAAAESTHGSNDGRVNSASDEGQQEQEHGPAEEDEMQTETEESRPNGVKVADSPTKQKEAIDELQADGETHKAEDLRPVKRQKQNSAQGMESEDELA